MGRMLSFPTNPIILSRLSSIMWLLIPPRDVAVPVLNIYFKAYQKFLSVVHACCKALYNNILVFIRFKIILQILQLMIDYSLTVNNNILPRWCMQFCIPSVPYIFLLEGDVVDPESLF